MSPFGMALPSLSVFGNVNLLYIMSLRLFHYEEQLQRDDVNAEHTQRMHIRISLCRAQKSDLSQSLRELLDDILAGRKRHKTYRQMKMYNDPTLNPQIYATQLRRAG